MLKAIWYFIPGGNCFDSRSSSARTARSTSSALADGSWMTPKPTRFQPLEAELRRVGLGAELGAADVLRARTSDRAVARLDDDVVELRRFVQPAGRAHAELVHLPGGRRRLPEAPAATWTFCSRSALTTSPAVIWRAASRSGSSHSRIEYLRSPKIVTSPTPGTRLSASLT